MAENNMEYRDWTKKEAAPRGFIAKLFTGELNNFRKPYRWLVLRGSKEKMKQLNLLRPDGSVPFHPKLHIVNYSKNQKKKRNNRTEEKIRYVKVRLVIFSIMLSLCYSNIIRVPHLL